MRVQQTNCLLVALFVCMALQGNTRAAEYYVRKAGSDNNAGTDRHQAFQTIAQAAKVAGNGDTIYIGAGTYDESVYINGAKNTNTGWAVFHGDQSGTQTGDKGTVIIRSRARAWAINARSVSNLLVTGITFQAHADNVGASYGCYVSDCGGVAKFTNCEFADLVFGTYAYGGGNGTMQVDGCLFQGGTYGIYAPNVESAQVSNCQFEAPRYSIVVRDTAKTHVHDSTFSNINSVTGVESASRGVHVVATSTVVQRCKFDGNTIGVYGTEAIGLLVEDCDIADTKSHAVYCYGQSLEMRDSRVRDGNYGITLADTSGNAALLSNVSVESMYIGVSANDGDYDFHKVALAENQYGVYQRSTCELLTIKSSDSIDFSNNAYAILTSHSADAPGTLSIEGQDFGGNASGILSYRSNVRLTTCVFAGERWGAHFSDSDSVKIQSCEFNGYETAPSQCSYGLYVRSDDIQIHDSTMRNANQGLYIDLVGQAPPDLKRVISENNPYTALRISNGTWTYTDADQNIFRNCSRGVMATNMNWKVVDVTTDGSCDYPVMDYYGDCTIEGAEVTGKVTGLYSYRSNSLTTTKLSVSGCGSYGLYVYDPVKADIDNVSATGNSNGVYVNDPNGTFTKITNSRFADNARYGLLLVNTSLDPSEVANLVIQDNYYGISIHSRPFVLNEDMNLTISGNYFGLMSYYAKLTISGAEIPENEIGAYTRDSDIHISDTTIAASRYGVLGYPNTECIIANSEITGAMYGIYIAPTEWFETAINISGSRIIDSSRCGVYVRGITGASKALNVHDTTFTDSYHGLVTDKAIVDAKRLKIDKMSGVGVYQVSGKTTLTDSAINSTNSWAVLAYGDHFDLARTKINQGRYGIGLLTLAGGIVNTTVNESEYGIYLNNSDANFSVMQTTVAGAKSYGLLKRNGDATVRNSIIDSRRYGFYNAGAGNITSDHNLVHSDLNGYVSTTPGKDDISKSPVFLNAPVGDLRLAAGSPAINAGTDLSASVTTDIDGNARPSFRAFELGAFEYLAPAGSLRVLDWDEIAR